MPRSSWPALALRIHTSPSSDRDRLWVFLHDLGATAVEGDVFEHDLLRVHFASEAARDAALQRVRTELPGEATAEIIDIPDEGWAERSQAGLRSLRVGDLLIQPPWDLPDAGTLSVIIEPSMGFGTGHHQSTRVCLLALQRLGVVGLSVMDVGTGSGVLAIAAVRLGAVSATALDVDEDALESARRNIDINGLQGRIEVICTDVRQWPAKGEADVVIANLTGPLLQETAEALCRMARRSGHIIVGGLTADEERAVTDAFRRTADLVWRDSEDEWMGLTFRRR